MPALVLPAGNAKQAATWDNLFYCDSCAMHDNYICHVYMRLLGIRFTNTTFNILSMFPLDKGIPQSQIKHRYKKI